MGVCKVKEQWLDGLPRKCLKGYKKDMCDPVLIAAILEELGFFDEEKDEFHDEGVNQENFQNGRKEEHKEK